MRMFLAVALSLSLLGMCSRKPQKNNVAISPGALADRYEYTYSGTMAYPIRYYKVSKGEDGGILVGWCDDEGMVTVLRGPEDALRKISEMAEKNSLGSLADSYRSELDILDGYGWHVSICYEEGTISSGGFNAYPPSDLYGGILAINEYIQGIIDSSSEEDVVGRKPYGRD